MRSIAVIAGIFVVASSMAAANDSSPEAATTSESSGSRAPSGAQSPATSSDGLGDLLSSPSSPSSGDSQSPTPTPGTAPQATPAASGEASTPPSGNAAPSETTAKWAPPGPDSRESVLSHGFYFSPMFSYVRTGDDLLEKSAPGGAIAFGFRRKHYAIELNGIYSQLKVKSGGTSISSYGGEVAILAFPFAFDSNLYGVVGGGVNSYNNKDDAKARLNNGLFFDVGIGQLLCFKLGSHEFGVRFDARFRHEQLSQSPMESNPQSVSQPPNGDSLPVKFNDLVANVGIVIPFGNHSAKEEPEPSVKVVPVQ